MSTMKKLIGIGVAVILTVACGGGTEKAEPVPESTADMAAPAPTLLPLPGETKPAPQAAAPATSGPLVWTPPTDWIQEQPRSNMRRAQYRVPGPDGDGECVVYYFGPGQGGDPQSNAARWAGQFSQPDGSSSLAAMKVTRLEGGALPIQIVEVTGTYDGGMTMTDAPAESRANHMLLGGIAIAADAPWFFKFTGPESTVRAQRKAFEGMLESLRASP